MSQFLKNLLSQTRSPVLYSELSSIHEISAGTFNRVFSAKAGVTNLIIKCFGEEFKSKQFKVIESKREERFWAEVSGARVFRNIIGDQHVPFFYYHDPKNRFILIEKITHASMLKDQLVKGKFDSELITSVCSLIGAIHQKSFDYKPNKILLNESAWDAEFHYHYLDLMPLVPQKTAKFLEKQVEFHKSHKDVFMHGDLTSRSVLIAKSGFYFIDFELSRLGYPSYDLGHFLAEFLLFGSQFPKYKPNIKKAFLESQKHYFSIFDKLPEKKVRQQILIDSSIAMLFRLIGRGKTQIISSSAKKNKIAEKLLTIIGPAITEDQLINL